MVARSKPDFEQIVRRFREMRLPVMADDLIAMESNGELGKMSVLQILDRLSIDEQLSRKNNTADRYSEAAGFYWPSANIISLDTQPERHINMAVLDCLTTCLNITSNRNALILGATRSGKTYMACALGNNACQMQYTVKYITMADYLYECNEAERSNTLQKYIRKTANKNLVIIDDFLLTSVTFKDAEHIYHLLNSKPRADRPRSFVICSTLMKEEMYNRLSQWASQSLADSIMSRISSNAYEIEIQGEPK
jgi:DNA replication protein DnaC